MLLTVVSAPDSRVPTYLKDNCWAMLEGLGVEFPEQRLSTHEKQK
jgi:hypothetical protein